MLRRWLAPAFLLALAAVLTAACADQYDPTPTHTPMPDLLVNGVVAEFQTPTGNFFAHATDPESIERLYQLESGELSGLFPNGIIAPGQGAGDHNAPWSWHMHRQTVDVVEVASPVCDGTLQEVEENLENWLQNIRRFCPHDAELVGITDYR